MSRLVCALVMIVVAAAVRAQPDVPVVPGSEWQYDALLATSVAAVGECERGEPQER